MSSVVPGSGTPRHTLWRWLSRLTPALLLGSFVAGPTTDLGAQSRPFVRGDVNADGDLNVADPVVLLNHLFAGEAAPPCADSADADDDGSLTISDGVRILNHLFGGGDPPIEPALECGDDPTPADDLGCDSFPPCDAGSVPPGFERIGVNEQGYEEYLHVGTPESTRTDVVFVLLPGGVFSMGSPTGECWRSEEEGPRHDVRLSPFLIAKHEISQEQWENVVGTTPAFFREDRVPLGTDVLRLPIESVTWDQVQIFESWTGLLLPTEAQWEYACRGGTTTAFAGGDTLSTDEANFWGTALEDSCRSGSGVYLGRTDYVDGFLPNGFGLYGMHGNVWEWCEDAWDPDFYGRPEASETDPVASAATDLRVIRGGSWMRCSRCCRSAARDRAPRDKGDYNDGFRPVCPLVR